MQQEQRPPQSLQERFGAAVGWQSFIAQVFAVSVHPMLRTTFGERHFGVQAGLVMVLIPVYSLFWREYDTSWLYWFLFAFMFTCAMAKKNIRVRAKRGQHEHSFYGGFPLLCRVWPFTRCSERAVKAVLEPLVVAGAGAWVVTVNLPLGCYLIWAAASLRLTQKLAEGYERTRMLDMRDAYLEQKHAAERFRSGDW